jgi:hypothetical protein
MFVGIPTTVVIGGAMQVQMFGLQMGKSKSTLLHGPYI